MTVEKARDLIFSMWQGIATDLGECHIDDLLDYAVGNGVITYEFFTENRLALQQVLIRMHGEVWIP